MAETIRIEIPIEVADETKEGLNSAINGLKKLEKAVDSMQNAYGKAEKKVSKFDKSAEKTQSRLQKWAKEKYQVLLDAKDKVSPVLKTLGSGLKTITGKVWSVTVKAFDMVTAPLRGILNLLKNPLLQAGAVLGVSFGVADSINTFKGFEQAMSQVSAISGATGGDLEKLTAKAKEMGATTKFTAQESAEAFNYMAMAGWKTEDMLQGIDGILSLAAASNEDLGTTSDIVTDALTAFKMEAKDAGHFSDVLAAAAANANTNVSMMGETFKYAGSMSGTLGYSIEDVALMTGLMANSGIKATMAGTALNMMFTRLSTNSGNARDALEDLGIAFFDDSGNARDLSEVMEELRSATSGMNDEQKASLANTIAGTQAQKGLLAILNASTKDYNKLQKAIENADGAAQQMSETMLDNMSGSLTLLQSALDNVKVNFGERLSPYVRGIAEWLTNQMPAINKALDSMMDWFDKKVSKLKERIKDMTGTAEWQNADFFGKVKIAWEDLIVNPFTEWWNSTGKNKVTEKAKAIGNAIGTGISTGIMTLLGIDIPDTVNEGASVGAAFARGFSDGFDLSGILGSLGDAFKNLLSSAGKLLPGGEEADFGSLISAALLAKIGMKVGTIGKGIFSAGKGVAEFGGKLGESGLGSLLQTVGGTGGLTGTAATVAGAGALAGGVVGIGTVISGLMDLHHALEENTKAEESDAYMASGAVKVGGVAAGAAAGAAIGSIVPGIGTLIGAGIGALVGGIGGNIGGNAITKHYEEEQAILAEENAKKALELEKAYRATGKAVEGVRFQEKYLNDALHDSKISAEEFSQILDQARYDKAVKAFGDIQLSVSDIQEMAEKIVIDEETLNDLKTFQKQSSKTKENFKKIKDTLNDIKKTQWKANMSLGLNAEEWASYKSQIDEVMDEMIDYIEDKHYEASLAVDLLFGANGADFTKLFDSIYASKTAQLEDIHMKLGAEFELETPDPMKIQELLNEAQEILNEINTAQFDAHLSTLEIEFEGAALNYDSFVQLQDQIWSDVNEYTQSYYDAHDVVVANLNMSLADGAITQDQYDQMKQEADEALQSQLWDLTAPAIEFSFDSIEDAWTQSLAGTSANLESLTSEQLTESLKRAFAMNRNPMEWTQDQVASWFGLESIKSVAPTAFDNIYSEIVSVAGNVPSGVKEQMISGIRSSVPTPKEIVDAIDFSSMNLGDLIAMEISAGISVPKEAGYDADWATPLTEFFGDSFEGSISTLAARMSQSMLTTLDPNQIATFMQTYMNQATELVGEIDSTGLTETLVGALPTDAEMAEELQGTLSDGSVIAGKYAEVVPDTEDILPEIEGKIDTAELVTEAMQDLPEDLDLGEEQKTAIQTALLNMIGESVENMDMSTVKTDLQTVVTTEIQAALEAADYSAAGKAVDQGVSDAIAANTGLVNAGITTLYTNTGTSLSTMFAAGFVVDVPVTLNFIVTSDTSGIASAAQAGANAIGAAAAASVGGMADGGMVNHPVFSLVGEAGPEAIIPLSPNRRDRGLDLFSQVAEIFGVGKYADGGIVGASAAAAQDARAEMLKQYIQGTKLSPSDDNEATGALNGEPYSVKTEDAQPKNTFQISVGVNMSPQMQISTQPGQSEKEILNVIKRHMHEIADEVGGDIAVNLEQIFSNMPLVQGG